VTDAGEAVDPREVADRYRRHVGRGRARVAELTGGLVEVSSEGSTVTDAQGRSYLDCGGYGVFLLGHRHPAVVAAVVDQVQRHPLSTRLMLEPTLARAAETLASVTPEGLDHVHFANSGAEATEAAIKLARASGRTTLVSASGGFHGKTMGALGLTANETYQAPFRPLLPDVVHVPFGDAAALGAVLTPETCVVLEPVQGEGGVVVPPAGYLADVARRCREAGAMLVLDEVQTGLGRLGTWWGADRDGVRPDVLLVGKGLSGGVVPAAAMVATARAYRPFSDDPFLHTSTFAGSPIAMAAATAAVTAIRDEGLVERARELGARLLPGLAEALAPCGPQVREVRGAGLLLGIELDDPGTALELVLDLLERGVLVNHSLNAHRVVRLTPPAVLTDAEADRLLEVVAAAALDLAGRSLGRTA
jgi:putrescine aminotransferase